MRILKSILILGFTLFTGAVFAQSKGTVKVVKDPLIDSLISRRINLNKGVTNNGTPIVVYGYRIQIFFGPDRREAYSEQARFKSMYPELGTYISYTSPNYRVKVGDFRTRLEAQKIMTELRSNFPTLFIFNERINPPKADN